MSCADWVWKALGIAALLGAAAGCAQPWRFAEPGCWSPVAEQSPLPAAADPVAQQPGPDDRALPVRPTADFSTGAHQPVGAVAPTACYGSAQAAAEATAEPLEPVSTSDVREQVSLSAVDQQGQAGWIGPAGWPAAAGIVRLPPVFDAPATAPLEWNSQSQPRVTYGAMGEPLSDSFGPLPAPTDLRGDPGQEAGERLPDGSVCLARARVGAMWREAVCNVRHDYRNYYSWVTFRDLALALGLAAPLANTSLDEDFQSWYQRDVRSSGTDDFARFWKTFGEGQIFIPAFAGLAFAGDLLEGLPLCGPAGEYSGRVTRAYLVGAPPMLLMQLVLGASRPDETTLGSQWKPFDDNNAVSGHAFVGAVPFIVAARMTDRPVLKAGFYLASTFTAWSRINDNAHYLSQAALGWWMAWLACRAVDEPDLRHRRVWFEPWGQPGTLGVALFCRG